MARSRRKTPIIGNTPCESEKKDKTFTNRKYRKAVRTLVKKADEDTVFPVIDEINTPWDFGKDGKQYFEKYEFKGKERLYRK